MSWFVTPLLKVDFLNSKTCFCSQLYGTYFKKVGLALPSNYTQNIITNSILNDVRLLADVVHFYSNKRPVPF